MKRVLITNQVPDALLEPLHGLADVIMGPNDGHTMPLDEVLEHAPTVNGIINQGELKVDAALLEHAPHLRIVANVAAGTNNLNGDLMAERGVWATNVPDAFGESTADFTFALLLGLVRRLPAADQYVRSGRWAHDGFQPGVWDGVLLSGKTLGIVGYGKIGQAVAKRARAFGMRVIFNRTQPSDDPASRTLPALLREADVVSLHTPLTEATHHLIGTDELALIKPGGYLINMARGPVVDEVALVSALQRGHLAGAALDVFEHEPSVHAALLTMDNVCLAPHIGGGTRESREAARRLCVDNVAAVLRGERPLTPINEPVLKPHL